MARLHELGDIALSVIVVLVSLVYLITPWQGIDAMLSVLVINQIVLGAWSVLRQQIGMLLREAPFDVEYFFLLLQEEQGSFELAALPVVLPTGELLDIQLRLRQRSERVIDTSALARLEETVREILHDQFDIEKQLRFSFGLIRQ
ncbi:MAG: hypothetical protein J2P36_17475 [Ktedonobacteraceae bacterium]|nr:hypothetical protein [Ktedonobacteraceae bacterium]